MIASWTVDTTVDTAFVSYPQFLAMINLAFQERLRTAADVR